MHFSEPNGYRRPILESFGRGRIWSTWGIIGRGPWYWKVYKMSRYVPSTSPTRVLFRLLMEKYRTLIFGGRSGRGEGSRAWRQRDNCVQSRWDHVFGLIWFVVGLRVFIWPGPCLSHHSLASFCSWAVCILTWIPIGGRQVDGAIPSLYALESIVKSPKIREAQKTGKLTILFDSGIRTGPDMFKALALGAQAVLRECLSILYPIIHEASRRACCASCFPESPTLHCLPRFVTVPLSSEEAQSTKGSLLYSFFLFPCRLFLPGHIRKALCVVNNRNLPSIRCVPSYFAYCEAEFPSATRILGAP
jgi:hypothetical protein